jgi:hypothetical protein
MSRSRFLSLIGLAIVALLGFISWRLLAKLAALLVFNILSIIHGHLGKGGLRRLFLTPMLEGREEAKPESLMQRS